MHKRSLLLYSLLRRILSQSKGHLIELITALNQSPFSVPDFHRLHFFKRVCTCRKCYTAGSHTAIIRKPTSFSEESRKYTMAYVPLLWPHLHSSGKSLQICLLITLQGCYERIKPHLWWAIAAELKVPSYYKFCMSQSGADWRPRHTFCNSLNFWSFLSNINGPVK